MRAVVDIAVATATAVATMAIGLLVVPVYLRVLGVEAYGLIGFLALLQGLLQLLDLGMIPTISRQVASSGARGSYATVRPLLAALARIYVLTGIVLAILIAAAAPFIATYWLTPQALSVDLVRDVVTLIGVVIAFRWPVGIYSGALIGGHRLSLVSVTNLAAGCAGSIGGVAVVLLHPSIALLVAWQAAVALAQLVAMRYFAWKLIGRPDVPVHVIAALRDVWRFSAGMGAITLVAVALSQLDKLLVSRLVTLEAFGLYTLATVVGRVLYALINPMYNVITPRFTAMHETRRDEALRHAYRQWTTIFCAVFFPATMALAVAARPLMEAWTGNPAIAAQVAPLAAMIAVGSGFHSVMYFPFALQVAVGDARTPLMINLLLLGFYLPLLTILVVTHGTFGAALAWLLLFVAYVPAGIWLTHRKLLPGTAWPWLAVDVGAPLAMTAAIGLAARAALPVISGHAWSQILVASGFAALAVALNASVVMLRFADLRTLIGTRLRGAGSTLQGR